MVAGKGISSTSLLFTSIKHMKRFNKVKDVSFLEKVVSNVIKENSRLLPYT